MVEVLRGSAWLYRALFVMLFTALMFLKLLPLGGLAGDWPGPDLLLCLILAWAMRRPDYLPVGLIAVVVLIEDLLLMRPPGLWTALVVMATEFLRSRAELTRELNFAVEWLLVAGLMVGLLLAYRLSLAVVLVPQAAFGFSMVQTLWSILCYPLVVMLSRLALDLRKPAMGEVDAKGRRM